jgi:hypothetical protein
MSSGWILVVPETIAPIAQNHEDDEGNTSHRIKKMRRNYAGKKKTNHSVISRSAGKTGCETAVQSNVEHERRQCGNYGHLQPRVTLLEPSLHRN